MGLTAVGMELDKVAPFLIKLFEIVSSAASDDLVLWSEHGDTFRIEDRNRFAQDVLPLYFKHDNLRSFIRQLNIYGFQRVPSAKGRDRTMEFFHPMFTRNGLRNLKEIKRGNQTKKDIQEHEEEVCHEEVEMPPATKKQRADYSACREDVLRLQKNLEQFETDLKEHTMQVEQKLAYILETLDDLPSPPNQKPPRSSSQEPSQLLGSQPQVQASQSSSGSNSGSISGSSSSSSRASMCQSQSKAESHSPTLQEVQQGMLEGQGQGQDGVEQGQRQQLQHQIQHRQALVEQPELERQQQGRQALALPQTQDMQLQAQEQEQVQEQAQPV